MGFSLPRSDDFVNAIKDALNLPPRVSRLVIEADVRQPLVIYVKCFPGEDGMAAVARAVAEVAVSPDGEVAVTPFAEELPEAA